MRQYRYPTKLSCTKSQDDFQHLPAADIDEVMEKLPKGLGITLANVQVEFGGEWRFASTLSPSFGGYNRGRA